MAKSLGRKHWDMALMDELEGTHPFETRLKGDPGAHPMASVPPGGNGSAVDQPASPPEASGTQTGHSGNPPGSGLAETDNRVVSNKKLHLTNYYQYLTKEIDRCDAEMLKLQRKREEVMNEIINLG